MVVLRCNYLGRLSGSQNNNDAIEHLKAGEKKKELLHQNALNIVLGYPHGPQHTFFT